VADDLDYLVTLAGLRILDALAGPLPETPADREGSERPGKDRKERSPASSVEEPGVPTGADRSAKTQRAMKESPQRRISLALAHSRKTA
jgi:hypothetical protein